MKKQKVAKKKGTMSRLLAYIVKDHKIMFSIVLFCILVSSLTSVVSTIFIQVLIDNYIEPMLSTGANLFPELLQTILLMVVIFAVGILSTYTYNFLMVIISLLRNRHNRPPDCLPVWQKPDGGRYALRPLFWIHRSFPHSVLRNRRRILACFPAFSLSNNATANALTGRPSKIR